MENWNCKQRARKWAKNSTMLKQIFQNDSAGWQAVWRKRIITAVAKLLLEAHQHGFDKGYEDGIKAAKKWLKPQEEKGE